MKAILVTGATTSVGRLLVDALCRAGVAHVLAVGAEPISECPFPVSDRVHYLQVDLARPRGIRELLFGPARDLGVEVIVHAALHRRARDEGSAIRRINVESTRALLHLAERHPTIRRFVFRSTVGVYRIRAEESALLDEDHPLDWSSGAPSWLRDRMEADLLVCTRMGLSRLEIMVLRAAECLAPECGSQLYDYLSAPLCLRPLGFDPMLNLLSPEDLVRALRLATVSRRQGIVNVRGMDTLPLSAVVRKWGRASLALPGPLLGPAYALRRAVTGADFLWDLNRWWFHFGGVPDGRRARELLGYEPKEPIHWPASVERAKSDRSSREPDEKPAVAFGFQPTPRRLTRSARAPLPVSRKRRVPSRTRRIRTSSR